MVKDQDKRGEIPAPACFAHAMNLSVNRTFDPIVNPPVTESCTIRATIPHIRC